MTYYQIQRADFNIEGFRFDSDNDQTVTDEAYRELEDRLTQLRAFTDLTESEAVVRDEMIRWTLNEMDNLRGGPIEELPEAVEDLQVGDYDLAGYMESSIDVFFESFRNGDELEELVDGNRDALVRQAIMHLYDNYVNQWRRPGWTEANGNPSDDEE